MFYGLLLFMIFPTWPVTWVGWAIIIICGPLYVFVFIKLFPTENLTWLQTVYFFIGIGLFVAIVKLDAHCGYCISQHFRDAI